jgi:two-component system, NarL family, response regulator LiaR
MSDGIRVLLVDDQRMFAEALDALLSATEGIESMGDVSSGEEMLDRCSSGCPDVVLMDLDLPGMDGIEATRRLRQVCPETQIVAITALKNDDLMARAIEAGASGFVPKSHAAEELLGIVRRAAAGEIVVPTEDLAATLLRLQVARASRTDAQNSAERLTDREVEILQAVADGKSTEDIATSLYLSPHTVNSHVRSILIKLGVHSKLDAVLFGLRHELIRVSRPDELPEGHRAPPGGHPNVRLRTESD